MLGKVSLVGAGSGDPELLTLRAYRLIREAEAVVYDNLVGDEVIALISPAARTVYAGKESGRHALPQGLSPRPTPAPGRGFFLGVRPAKCYGLTPKNFACQ